MKHDCNTVLRYITSQYLPGAETSGAEIFSAELPGAETTALNRRCCTGGAESYRTHIHTHTHT